MELVTADCEDASTPAGGFLPFRFFLKILANFSGRNELDEPAMPLPSASALSLRFFCLARDLVPGPARASTTWKEDNQGD